MQHTYIYSRVPQPWLIPPNVRDTGVYISLPNKVFILYFILIKGIQYLAIPQLYTGVASALGIAQRSFYPWHLRWGTQQDNMADYYHGVAQGGA